MLINAPGQQRDVQGGFATESENVDVVCCMGISLVEGAGFSIHVLVFRFIINLFIPLKYFAISPLVQIVTDHIFIIVKSSGVYDGKVCADFVCTRHTSIVHE